ncbi:MAG TPA: DUF4290 domain-containing protein [Bacteroidales bacterium]|nr:DUF4290 domain-containing protein [Bacteroidales bacterium]
MGFDYNTQRKRMVLPEYGRNIQKMVDYLKTIKDRDERNRAAATIIHIMGNLNPQLRDVEDFKHKLWDHLALIADCDLDIDSPYPPPEKSKLAEKPNRIPYPQGNIRFLHYGKNIEMMIDAVSKMPDGEEKDYLTYLIINQMKKLYITWNRPQVSDDIILSDLKCLSGGKLTIPEGMKIPEAKELMAQNKKKQQTNKHNKQQNKHSQKKKGFNRH